MKIIGELFLWLSNITGYLFITILFAGVIIDIIKKVVSIKMSKDKKKEADLVPLVEEIKKKIVDEEKQEEALYNLYKENNYSIIKSSAIFMVLNVLIYGVLMVTLFRLNNFGLNFSSVNVSFFNISNIFEINRGMQYIYLPVIISVFKILISITNLKGKKIVGELISMGVLSIVNIIMLFIFPTSLLILNLGYILSDIMFNIIKLVRDKTKKIRDN